MSHVNARPRDALRGAARRRRRALAAFATVALLAVLAGFALELADTQAKSRADVVGRVQERAAIAVSLIDALFQSAAASPETSRLYGGRTVTDATMEKERRTSTYLALLGPDGAVLAASNGFPAGLRTRAAALPAVELASRSGSYGLGNVRPYRADGVVDFAVPILTRYGRRTLVVGFKPADLSAFVEGELAKISGVDGSQRYLLDGNSQVVASTDPAQPQGVGLRPDGIGARGSAVVDGTYIEQVPLAHSSWRLRLTAPEGKLFASVTGVRKWVPWVIYLALALALGVAFGFFRRTLVAADQARATSDKLAQLNEELATSNAALNRRAAELARSNEELDQFAFIASHDLQEPLRKVRTFTQRVSVMESEQLSDKGLDYLHRANAAAERMQRLIEDLLAFSRIASRPSGFEAVELGELTHEVLVDLDHALERSGGEVRVGALPRVHGDPSQLRQLLQNLIVNGLKFHREGVPPVVSVEAEVTGDLATLIVRDNGIGFESAYAERIFRVFERLHGRTEYAGTGIGLAICRKIVERHGGAMVAEGHPGEGAAFIITLPVGQREEVIARDGHPVRDAAHHRDEPSVHA
jgi:signal transduction histidine kinase